MMPQSMLKFALFVLFALISNVQSKTKGPRDATETQFPWLVGINVTYEDGSQRFCAGSIIKSRWILSTANCVKGAKKAEIYVARTDLNSFSGFTVVTDEFVINTDYQEDAFYADIALIKLKTDLCFNEYINFIQVDVDQTPTMRMTIQVVTVPGWGIAAENLLNYNNSKLQYLNVFMITSEECATYYTERISNKEFCTETAPDNNSCHPSYGSAAVVNYGKDDRLVGLFSYFGNACDHGRPMGFVDVRKFAKWIEDHTNSRNHSTTTDFFFDI